MPFTEEVNLTYSQLAPMLTRNVNSWMWMLFTNSAVRSPTAKWPAMRPILYASANSLRSVPKWRPMPRYAIAAISMS